jgi:hypothetical protein
MMNSPPEESERDEAREISPVGDREVKVRTSNYGIKNR